MKLMIPALLLLAIATVLHSVAARSMWGSRRKRDQDNDEGSVPPSTARSFDTLREQGRPSAGVRIGSAGRQDLNEQITSSAIEEVVNLYVSMVEEMMESEDFDKLVNPESIQAMMSQFPGLEENSEIATLLQSPELQNPKVLRNTLRQGLETVKMAVPEMMATINDPIRMAELMEQLPPEMQLLLEGMRTGDMSVFKTLIQNLPGLDEDQKTMLSSLMDGNTDVLTEQLQQVLGDTDQIEAARQQFLESPEMAEALGIPMEVLNDPEQWAALMSQGMEALSSGTAGDDEHNAGNRAAGQQKKQFGRFNRAAA